MVDGHSIVNEFDEFSVNYTEDMVNCVPYYTKLLSAFTEYLPTGFEPRHILDLGCGNGNVTAQLTPSFPKAHITLLDASKEMLELCRNRFKGFRVNFVTSYFKDFLFPENNFDLITAGFSIHHCDTSEKQELFQKIYHSLKPNGLFCYTDLMIDRNTEEHTPFLKKWKTFVLKNYPNQEKWKWLMEHYNEFDKPESLQCQVACLKEIGFKKIKPFINDHYWVYLSASKG